VVGELKHSISALALVPLEFRARVIALYVSGIDFALVTVVPWAGAAAFMILLIKNHSMIERSAMKTMVDEVGLEEMEMEYRSKWSDQKRSDQKDCE
jgi:hypothetical protein